MPLLSPLGFQARASLTSRKRAVEEVTDRLFGGFEIAIQLRHCQHLIRE